MNGEIVDRDFLNIIGTWALIKGYMRKGDPTWFLFLSGHYIAKI